MRRPPGSMGTNVRRDALMASVNGGTSQSSSGAEDFESRAAYREAKKKLSKPRERGGRNRKKERAMVRRLMVVIPGRANEMNAM